jgi:predicted transcriptional regulator
MMTLRLDADVDAEVTRSAKIQGISKALLVERAVAEYLSKHTLVGITTPGGFHRCACGEIECELMVRT